MLTASGAHSPERLQLCLLKYALIRLLLYALLMSAETRPLLFFVVAVVAVLERAELTGGLRAFVFVDFFIVVLPI